MKRIDNIKLYRCKEQLNWPLVRTFWWLIFIYQLIFLI